MTPQPTDESPLGWSLLPPQETRTLFLQRWFNDNIWRPAKGYRAVKGRWTFVGAPVLFCAAVTALFIPQLSREQEHRVDPSLASAPAPRVWHGFRGPTTTLPPSPSVPPKPVGHAVPPRASRGCTRSLDQIAQDESGGDYTAQNPRTSASGKYQVLDSTWGRFGGYTHAKDAPPAVQEQWAQQAYARYGTKPWKASGC